MQSATDSARSATSWETVIESGLRIGLAAHRTWGGRGLLMDYTLANPRHGTAFVRGSGSVLRACTQDTQVGEDACLNP